MCRQFMYRLGIDLGGTNIVAGVVDENYEIIAKASCKTNVPRPESEICDSMADVALKAIEKAKLTIDDIESIGIGVPGAVNPKTGVIEYSANLFFHNWQVVKMMEERLNTKICVENDANAAALGEYLAGSAKGAKNAIAITLGTGPRGQLAGKIAGRLLPLKEKSDLLLNLRRPQNNILPDGFFKCRKPPPVVSWNPGIVSWSVSAG